MFLVFFVPCVRRAELTGTRPVRAGSASGVRGRTGNRTHPAPDPVSGRGKLVRLNVFPRRGQRRQEQHHVVLAGVAHLVPGGLGEERVPSAAVGVPSPAARVTRMVPSSGV